MLISKKTFEELLSKQMTRKEFLIYLGLVMLTISGFLGLIRAIVNPHKVSSGFGAGPYGK